MSQRPEKKELNLSNFSFKFSIGIKNKHKLNTKMSSINNYQLYYYLSGRGLDQSPSIDNFSTIINKNSILYKHKESVNNSNFERLMFIENGASYLGKKISLVKNKKSNKESIEKSQHFSDITTKILRVSSYIITLAGIALPGLLIHYYSNPSSKLSPLQFAITTITPALAITGGICLGIFSHYCATSSEVKEAQKDYLNHMQYIDGIFQEYNNSNNNKFDPINKAVHFKLTNSPNFKNHIRNHTKVLDEEGCKEIKSDYLSLFDELHILSLQL